MNSKKNKLTVGVWSFYSEFSQNDFMLTNIGSGLGDDDFWGVNELYRKGKLDSIIFKTLDQVEDWLCLDAILVFDYPTPVNRKCPISRKIVDKILCFHVPSFLILHECAVIKPNNWIVENHKNWTKIFTWNDEYTVNGQYIKLNMPPRKIKKNWRKYEVPKKFSTLIVSNKRSSRVNEAYSDRLKCIKWFEKHHPEKLDLFGFGWDQYRLPDRNRVFQKLNRMPSLMRIFGPRYRVWQGELSSKQDIAWNYRFQFAFENAKNIPGYILEKIIDSFLLGSVPIYLGANNISSHIPADCYIDFRDFTDYADLYTFLLSIKDDEYCNYIDRISEFIDGPSFYPFSSECYVETILQTIKKEIQYKFSGNT